MKKIVILLIAILIFGCEDEVLISPIKDEPVKYYGVTGIVVDTSGNPLDSVQIYCLFYLNYVPTPVTSSQIFSKIGASGSFDFQLHQNFPNPFSSSTFIRFGLPSKSKVDLVILEKLSGAVGFRFSDTLFAGLYQVYLDRLVDSSYLKNGAYQYTLKAVGVDGKTYEAQKEMFVISNRGKPDTITGKDGKYLFEYKYGLVGDSVIVTDMQQYTYTQYLTYTLNFMVKKTGYRTRYIKTDIFPNLLFNQDIVLIKEGPR